jgi:taurine dioxygenase
MPTTALALSPLAEGFGAEIRGIDARRLDDPTFGAVEAAFARYGVILVRGQGLDPAAFRGFVARFGPLEAHTLLQYTLPEDPYVYVLSNVEKDGRPIGAHNEGIGWHTDLSYKERPVMATALYGVICPPEGADTLIADMAAAFERLPEARRRQLDGLRIQHSYQRWMATRADRAPLTEAQKALTPDVDHPLVRTHPVTGRKSLFLGTGTVMGIEGMPEAEGKALVAELVAHATGGDFTYTHKWREGDLLMWDNRWTLHTGTLFDDTRYKRLVWRMMVKGGVPA